MYLKDPQQELTKIYPIPGGSPEAPLTSGGAKAPPCPPCNAHPALSSQGELRPSHQPASSTVVVQRLHPVLCLLL